MIVPTAKLSMMPRCLLSTEYVASWGDKGAAQQ
jgi:hypothetical protein